MLAGAFQQVSQSQSSAQSVSTQTSPRQQLVQTASFDSAQSHNARQIAGEECSGDHSGSATGHSFTARPLLSGQLAASELSLSVERAPPPPGPGQDSGPEACAHPPPLDPCREGPHVELQRHSASQYSLEDDVLNSSLGQSRTLSSRSTYSPFEAATQSAAAQHAVQQLQLGNMAAPLSPLRSRPPSADRVSNAQHVSDWAMQAQLQSNMERLDNSMATQPHPSGRTHSRSEAGTPHPPVLSPIGGMLRAQSYNPRTRLADQLHPTPVQTPARGRRATLETSPGMNPSRTDQRCTSQELYRDVFVPSVKSSSFDVFESLGCRLIPYDELDIKRKIGDGSIGQVLCLTSAQRCI